MAGRKGSCGGETRPSEPIGLKVNHPLHHGALAEVLLTAHERDSDLLALRGIGVAGHNRKRQIESLALLRAEKKRHRPNNACGLKAQRIRGSYRIKEFVLPLKTAHNQPAVGWKTEEPAAVYDAEFVEALPPLPEQNLETRFA